jgi:hypothetical protein
MWRHTNPPVHGMWDVSLALKMTLRTDYYADAERFEIQGEEGIIQVTRCSDRMLDEPVLRSTEMAKCAPSTTSTPTGAAASPCPRATSSTCSQDGNRKRRLMRKRVGGQSLSMISFSAVMLSDARWQDSGGSDRGLRSLSKLVGAGVGIALPMGTPGNTLRVVIRRILALRIRLVSCSWGGHAKIFFHPTPHA